jgi:hypothetical protein
MLPMCLTVRKHTTRRVFDTTVDSMELLLNQT